MYMPLAGAFMGGRPREITSAITGAALAIVVSRSH